MTITEAKKNQTTTLQNFAFFYCTRSAYYLNILLADLLTPLNTITMKRLPQIHAKQRDQTGYHLHEIERNPVSNPYLFC